MLRTNKNTTAMFIFFQFDGFEVMSCLTFETRLPTLKNKMLDFKMALNLKNDCKYCFSCYFYYNTQAEKLG